MDKVGCKRGVRSGLPPPHPGLSSQAVIYLICLSQGVKTPAGHLVAEGRMRVENGSSRAAGLNLCGTRDWFHGRQFFVDQGEGWFPDDPRALHLLCTFFLLLLHQLHFRSSGIRYWRLGTSALQNGQRRPQEDEPEARWRDRGSTFAEAQIMCQHLGCKETQGRTAHQRPSRPSIHSHLVPPGPTWLLRPAPPMAAALGGGTLPWGPDAPLKIVVYEEETRLTAFSKEAPGSCCRL